MSEIKAGVIVTTKFCQSNSDMFSSYINYIDREEAARTENTFKYNLYQDYMGNPEKTTGLFNKEKELQTQEEKDSIKNIFKMAQENNSLMWQTVISFDNRWLEKNGLYQSENSLLDEKRLQGITRTAVNKMLEKEGLQNAVWSAAIHYNTDNVHVHVATVEPMPLRAKKEYIQYQNKTVNGKKIKEPILDEQGRPVTKFEYKGRFKQSSIEACKSEVVNQIINEKENNIKINSIIRDSIVAQKKEHPLSKDKDLCKMVDNLYNKMPDVDRKLWNYNNPIMHNLKEDINAISLKYIEKYHSEEFNEFKKMILEQEQKYKEAYGGESDYTQNKMNDLYTRLGNQVLKELRQYDKAQKEINKQAIKNKKDPNYIKKRSLNLSSCISRMKRGLKSAWDKTRLEREHDQMIETSIEQ